MIRLIHLGLFSCWLGLLVQTSIADIRLPHLFSDHMVLQRDQKIRVWGWGDKGEQVTVRIGENRGVTQVDEQGKWKVELEPMDANKQPQSLHVEGKNKIEIKDVLIGEVWLCSGQSNMEWTVAASLNPQQEIAAANYPLIRHIKVPLVPSNVPLEDFNSNWQACSPDTAGSFTACGYFMARKLFQELDIPIGLVNSSWGGTRIEPWTPPVGFASVPALEEISRSVVGRSPGTEAYRSRLVNHLAEVESWLKTARESLEKNSQVAPSPSYPAELAPFTSHQDPTMLYNGMIHSVVGFGIRGAIWYQGESNHQEGMLYFEKKKALVKGWRELWKQGEFPFYFVQIAPFNYGHQDTSILPKFWEAQAACQSIPKCAMVVINDIATLNDIHPPNKQDVGLRLALLALKNDYGKSDLVANNPEVDRLEILQDRLVLHFRNSGGGLKTRDGKKPSHFEVIGIGSNGFQPANAEVDGDRVILTSDKVKSPVAYRFAWNMLAEPNLTGGTGLPVGAVRGGEIPDFFSSVPTAKEYSLVYDLDLNKLGEVIRYDVDRSMSIKAFDRVAYLLELTTADRAERKVFVSMDSYTNDVKKIGIPTFASKAVFQQEVKNLDVFSNVQEFQTGSKIGGGHIEFWPHNYTAKNIAKVPGASEDVYDFGDEMFPPDDGYGSMQIHNVSKGETLFAINHWRLGAQADIGIGNSSGKTRDWTFAGNAGSYPEKRLRVFVRERK